MKVHKIEMMVLNFEGVSDADLIEALQRNRYVIPVVIDMKTAEIGTWDDSNPLNKDDATRDQELARLFPIKTDSI